MERYGATDEEIAQWKRKRSVSNDDVRESKLRETNEENKKVNI